MEFIDDRLVRIQPANTESGEYDVHVPQPYPYYIDAEGKVAEQEFWKGDPLQLIGFQDRADRQKLNITFKQFWDDPTVAEGRFPVFLQGSGTFYNLTVPISSAVVQRPTAMGYAKRDP